MDTQTQIDRLIELAIIQRSELKQLVEQLPQLREHLNAEVEKVFEETEPQLRAELEDWTTKQTSDKAAALGAALEAKITDLAKSLEISTQARYNAIIAEREENTRLAAQAEQKIAEHAASLPSAVKDIVTAELARFPRAGEIDQLRKEFAEPKSLNPRGKWQAGETYNKLDLVTINGDSYTSAIDGNKTRPTRSSADWTLVAARGTGGGGGPTSLTDLTAVPQNGELLIGNGSAFVNNTLTAGTGVTITNGAGTITIDASGAQELLTATVKNADSVAITKGQVVYLFGATGGFPSVKLANNTSDATSNKTFGVVSDTSIAPNGTGTVTCVGVVDGLNLGAYNDGDAVYLGATAGAFTATKPYAPNHLVFVGIIERANAGNGELYVRIQNGYELEELHNVQITTPPLAGSLLMYDATNSLWKANRLTAGTNIAVTNADTSVTLGLTGTVAVANGGTGVTTSTGSGSVVLSTSPTLTTPILGTPQSGTLTSCTGLPISTGVSGLGTNVATFLATPSSANLAAAVTDETGTGALVFANTPTLVTPNIGAATGTSVNLSGAGTFGGNLTVSGTGTNLFGGGSRDAFVIESDTAGNGAFASAKNAAANDYEPLLLIGETITLKYRSGVNSSTAGLTLTSTGTTLAGNLTVSGTDIKINNSTGYLYVDSGSSLTGMVLSRTNNILELYTTNVARLTISSAGNTTLAGNLTVSGTGTSALTSSSANLVVGSTTATSTNAVGVPQITTESDLYSSICSMAHNNTNGNHGFLMVGKSRGTKASPTILADGDVFGELGFVAYDGAAYRTAGQIRSVIAGTPGATDLPCALDFRVAPDGSSTPATAMRIAPTGNLLLKSDGIDSSNGKLQLATHTTSAGGIGFGTDLSLYRANTGFLILNDASAALDCRIGLFNQGTQRGLFEAYNVASAVYMGAASAGWATIITSGNQATALTLDSSQNATFAGNVYIQSGNALRLYNPTNAAFASIQMDANNVVNVNYTTAFGVTIRTQGGTASTPASASAAGVAGTIQWDASYIYVCTAANTWKRVAIATW